MCHRIFNLPELSLAAGIHRGFSVVTRLLLQPHAELNAAPPTAAIHPCFWLIFGFLGGLHSKSQGNYLKIFTKN